MRTAERNRKRSGLSLLTAALLASAMAAVPQYANAASWFRGPEFGATMVPRPMQHKPRTKTPKSRAGGRKARARRTADHRDLDPAPASQGVRRQRPVRRDANLTGMPGHATPMGVFSVLEKQRWHRSNIYSGAPMPYNAAHHLVRRRDSRGRSARLSGVPRLHSHARSRSRSRCSVGPGAAPA